MEQIKEISLTEARKMQARGQLDQGNLVAVSDGVLRRENGVERLYETAVSVEADSLQIVIFGINCWTGNVEKINLTTWFDSSKLPYNIELLQPNDFLTFMKLKRDLEVKGGTIL